MRCPTCGEAFGSEQGVRIHHAHTHGESLPNRECVGCGTAFYDKKARRSYCDDCNPNAGANNGNWRGGKVQTRCNRCGCEFEFYPSDKEGLYCPECVADADEFLGDPFVKDATVLTRECEFCRCDMDVLQSRIENGGGRFCSHQCLSQWMAENVVGVSHHQWNGGAQTYGGAWWATRRQALQRDGHKCRSCGATREELGQEPDVHHIRPVRKFDDPQDAHRLDNVVSLCRSCHRNVEEGNIPVPSPSPER